MQEMTPKQEAVEDLAELLDSLTSKQSWQMFNKLTFSELVYLKQAIEIKVKEHQIPKGDDDDEVGKDNET